MANILKCKAMDLKLLVNKKKITKAEKEYLIDRAEELGIEYNLKTGCNSCYNDIAVLIYAKEKEESGEISNISPKLKPNIDIIFLGQRVNSATITQEITDTMIKIGLKKFFE